MDHLTQLLTKAKGYDDDTLNMSNKTYDYNLSFNRYFYYCKRIIQAHATAQTIGLYQAVPSCLTLPNFTYGIGFGHGKVPDFVYVCSTKKPKSGFGLLSINPEGHYFLSPDLPGKQEKYKTLHHPIWLCGFERALLTYTDKFPLVLNKLLTCVPVSQSTLKTSKLNEQLQHIANFKKEVKHAKQARSKN